MEHAYWGVKCKNPECQHYILREDLSLQPEGIVGIPPEPYPMVLEPIKLLYIVLPLIAVSN